ncbi:hypothetical protein [Metamycoplasma equirhinis]|uniref:hypothetical protein n=1 Tax=Metamycoplasma equirhinis TaxID=92402 RepID=UPI003593C1EF
MEAKPKKVLDKYYISEAFDADRNISFNFKKANKKISGNFKEFTEAVEEFIRVSEKSKNDTRVWFHRDGAYRGSVGIEKARAIVGIVKEKAIQNENVIEFIEKENLVEKSTKKTTTKKAVEEPVKVMDKTSVKAVKKDEPMTEVSCATCNPYARKSKFVPKRQRNAFWSLFSFLIVLVVINIILIALRLAKVY